MIDSRPRAKQGSLIVNVVIDIEYTKLEHLLDTTTSSTTRPKNDFLSMSIIIYDNFGIIVNN